MPQNLLVDVFGDLKLGGSARYTLVFSSLEGRARLLVGNRVIRLSRIQLSQVIDEIVRTQALSEKGVGMVLCDDCAEWRVQVTMDYASNFFVLGGSELPPLVALLASLAKP